MTVWWWDPFPEWLMHHSPALLHSPICVCHRCREGIPAPCKTTSIRSWLHPFPVAITTGGTHEHTSNLSLYCSTLWHSQFTVHVECYHQPSPMQVPVFGCNRRNKTTFMLIAYYLAATQKLIYYSTTCKQEKYWDRWDLIYDCGPPVATLSRRLPLRIKLLTRTH